MATKSDEAATHLYIQIMEEVKARAATINTVTALKTNIPIQILREFCFLELRMICELVALGCLVAHGDISRTKYLQQEAWRPDDIFKKLGELNPEFFPRPGKPVFKPGHLHLEDVDFEYSTKEELIKLYGKCGDVLHKGALSRLISPGPQPNEFSDIASWGQKLMNLLSCHRITRIGGNFHFVVFLSHRDHGNNVHVMIAESDN